MNKSSKTILTVALLVVVAVVIFVALRTDSPSPEPAEAVTAPPAPVSTQTVEPAPKAPETPEPVAESTVAELQIPEPPALDNAEVSLIRVSPQVEPPAESEAGKFLKAMKEKLGMDKIKTMKMKMAMEMSMTTPQGPMTITSDCDVLIEMPGKMYNVFEVNAGGNKMKMYQVTDGVFMEMGQMSADGKRNPMQMRKSGVTDGQMSLFTGGAFDDSAYASGELKSVTVDPSDPLFQKEDGTPLDNLELTVLTISQMGFDIETYVDPQTMEMRAMRMFKDGKVAIECSRVKFQDVAEGVRYPVGYDMSMNAAAMGAAQGAPQEMKMKLSVSEVKVNPELDAGVFNFTPNLTPAQ